MVPFTDSHLNPPFNPNPAPDRRMFDTRNMTTVFTPPDQFFTTQHYGHPEVDPVAYRLKVGGLVNAPLTLSLDDLKKMGNAELVNGFECSGNRRPVQGLIGNGRWTGVPLKTLLDKAGMKSNAREVVFFGADRGKESVNFRGTNFDVEQQYGRSIQRDQALSSDRAPFLAYALNGEPLTKHQGAPLRLIMPGWYGAPNVKWLSDIYLQEEPYLGKFQANWYRTLRGEMINGEVKWVEKAVSHLQLKSFVARVSKNGADHKITAIVLNDGTPIKTVEVKVDDGQWMPATLDPQTNAKYGWKLYYYTWKGAPKGEHTLVSRVTDANGMVQPTAEEIDSKKTFLEDNSQHPRKVMIG
jgi:DMSO/TMAO reductase YedYZ molybdopterin-dependent catalytic subunit